MKLLLTALVIVAGLFIVNVSRKWRSGRESLKGLYPSPGQGTDADVERLVRAGRKMSAIKLYREIHDVDLKASKDAVDKVARGIKAGG